MTDKQKSTMPIDGTYTPPPPPPIDDPVSGVTVSKFSVSFAERTASIELSFWTFSGAFDHTESLTLMSDEFDSFARQVWPAMDFGKSCIAALKARLPDVTGAAAGAAQIVKG